MDKYTKYAKDNNQTRTWALLNYKEEKSSKKTKELKISKKETKDEAFNTNIDTTTNDSVQ